MDQCLVWGCTVFFSNGAVVCRWSHTNSWCQLFDIVEDQAQLGHSRIVIFIFRSIHSRHQNHHMASWSVESLICWWHVVYFDLQAWRSALSAIRKLLSSAFLQACSKNKLCTNCLDGSNRLNWTLPRQKTFGWQQGSDSHDIKVDSWRINHHTNHQSTWHVFYKLDV